MCNLANGKIEKCELPPIAIGRAETSNIPFLAIKRAFKTSEIEIQNHFGNIKMQSKKNFTRNASPNS